MSKCKTCNGYGVWAMGDSSPMGVMDASDGCPTKACPECGANVNPMNGEERVITMWRTLDGRSIPIKDLTDEHLKNIIIHIKERVKPKKGLIYFPIDEKQEGELLKIMIKEQKRRKVKK